MTTTKNLAVVSDLDRYIAEVNRYPMLSAEDELALANRWTNDGDVSAAHAMVTSNLRFVVKVAHEYRGYGAKILDLIQEGSIGLMQAVRRFDPSRGYRLLTYASYWIRSYIHSFLMRTMRMIKIGTSRAHRKLFFKMRSLKGKLAAEGHTNHDEVVDMVAKEIGVERGDVIEMEGHFSGKDASLDAPTKETGTALSELLPASGPTQEEVLAELEWEADRAAQIEVAMQGLDPRERTIVQKRYLAEEPEQLKEIGAELGVSKQRVAQLERRAIEKLRASLQDAA